MVQKVYCAGERGGLEDIKPLAELTVGGRQCPVSNGKVTLEGIDYTVLVGNQVAVRGGDENFILAESCSQIERLKTGGRLIISNPDFRAKSRIEADGGIDAVGSIRAERDINADNGPIRAGGDIYSHSGAINSFKGDIAAGGSITSGDSLIAWDGSITANGDIESKSGVMRARGPIISKSGGIRAKDDIVSATDEVYAYKDILSLQGRIRFRENQRKAGPGQTLTNRLK
ncbi:MAG: hypothetical protein V1921_02665 [Candidatus Altiarchaeota archaeon]